MNLELTNFSKSVLGISPDALFEEFKNMKGSQHLNLQAKDTIESWLELKAKQVKPSRGLNELD